MTHPGQDQLLDFLTGRYTQEQAQDVFMHLAECTACTRRVQTLRFLRSDPAGAWVGFLDEAAERRHEPAEEAPMSFTWAGKGLIDLARGLIAGARALATPIASPRGALPGESTISVLPTPTYQGVGNAGSRERAHHLLRRAADHCSRGEDEQARTALAAAAKIDAEATSSASLDLRSEGRMAGRVIVDARRRTVAVLVYPETLPCTAWVVELRTLGEEDTLTRTAALVPVEGATYLLAEFHEVPDGPFTVSISRG